VRAVSKGQVGVTRLLWLNLLSGPGVFYWKGGQKYYYPESVLDLIILVGHECNNRFINVRTSYNSQYVFNRLG